MTYEATRDRLEHYFDRTAAETWARLTSDAPVSRVRRTVRAGRDAMRAAMLARLPGDLTGLRVLDAGAGAGQMTQALAERGAEVVAADISPALLAVAQARIPERLHGRIRFAAGDMLDEGLGRFDHVVAMDSLIHYRATDAVKALAGLAPRVRRSILFTFAPRTPLLAGMHVLGRAFPRGDRAPAIEPVGEAALHRLIAREPGLAAFEPARSRRISKGFYTSQGLELLRP
jgi:magnesium-protoporphyrin O-methyltransferase